MANKDTVRKRDREMFKKAKAQAKRARKLERRKAAQSDLPEPGAAENFSLVVVPPGGNKEKQNMEKIHAEL